MGKISKILTFFLLLFCSHAHADFLDIVIDIDNVLTHYVDEEIISMAEDHNLMDRYIFFDNNRQDDHFRKANSVEQALMYFSQLPNARISYLSNGYNSRNTRLLNEIILPDGRPAAEI